MAPATLALATDEGAFATLRGQHVRVTGERRLSSASQ
jgi:hypothetical protein